MKVEDSSSIGKSSLFYSELVSSELADLSIGGLRVSPVILLYLFKSCKSVLLVAYMDLLFVLWCLFTLSFL